MLSHKRAPWVFGLILCLTTQCLFAQRPKLLEPLEPPPEEPNAPKVRMYTPEETIRIFQKKVAASPKNTFLLSKLGQAYLFAARQTGNEKYYLDAEREFLKVLKLQPRSPGARASLAAAYMAQHRFREALELSQAVYKENSKYTMALANIGDAQLELGRYEEADKSIQELKAKAPADNPEVLARLARILELRGNTEEAAALIQKALKIEQTNKPRSPELAWYDLRLGEIAFNSNQIDKADAHYQSSLKRRENYVPALLGLGQVRAAQGRYDEAAALYERAVAQKGDFDLIGDLAVLYSLGGHEAKAKALAEKAVSLVPVAAKVETEARHLALFLADREIQLDLALESARKELKVRQDVFAYDVLAWTLLKSGQTEAAWEAMQKALRIGTKDARMHFHAGMIALKLGRTAAAQEHLSKSLEINPHFAFTDPQQARKTLAELKAQ